MKTREQKNAYYREYHKKLRPKLKKKGICMMCKKRPADKPRVSCKECTLNKNLLVKFKNSKEHIFRYKYLLEKQQEKCAICKTESKKLNIDHKHNGVERIRGLLCTSCNVAIGLLKEDPNIIYSAFQYLVTNKL